MSGVSTASMVAMGVAAAASAASMAANSSAQGAISGARTGVFNSDYGQQEGFQNQIDNVNTKSQNLFSTAPADMAAKTSDVANFYKSTGGVAPQSGPITGTLPGQSSDILTQDAGRQNGKVAAYTGQQEGALAAMRGLGDTLSGDSRGVALNNANAGVLQSDKSGVASLLPVELANANNAGNSDKMLGDILGGLGKVAMTYGLSGSGGASKPTSFYDPTNGTNNGVMNGP